MGANETADHADAANVSRSKNGSARAPAGAAVILTSSSRHRRPASPQDRRRARTSPSRHIMVPAYGSHRGNTAGARPDDVHEALADDPAARKGGSRVLLTPRSEIRGSQNGAMAPFSARATTRKAPKSTREPPFHTTGCPVARPDRDNRGRQSVDGDAVDNNGNAVTSEDVLSGPLRPADPD